MSLNTTADTKYIKLFSPVEFSENTYMVRNNLTEFPTNPKIGMDCMVKGMVYSYTQLDGYEFWMPSGVRRNYYIHNQDKFESDTWEIIHNLNSYDLTISIFDEDNVSISAQYKIIDENNVVIEFAVPIKGRAAIFATVGNANDEGFPTYTPLRAIREVKVNMDSTENPNVIDLNKGNLYLKTIVENTTLSVSNITTIQNTVNTFMLELTNGGNFTVNWWKNIKWDNGKAPELTKDGTDILGFYTHDGVNWRGVLMSKDIK